MDYYRIGQQIRKYRKLHNMSQEELAEAVGISVTHMSHIETGNTKLSLQVFSDIVKVLGISSDNLLMENDSETEIVYNELLSIIEACTPRQASLLIDMIRQMKIVIEKHKV